jgi:low affinity Fe/Cu permease
VNRIFSSIALAFCSVIGVLLLLNACMSIVGLALHPLAHRTDALLTIVVAVGVAAFASVLLAAAVRLRKRLQALDAKVDEPNVTE